MSLLTDVQYWEDRGWDAISKPNKAIVEAYEKCRTVYTRGIKEGVIDSDDPKLSFKFDKRTSKRGMFSVTEVRRAAEIIGYDAEQINELEETIRALVPDTESYFLKFR